MDLSLKVLSPAKLKEWRSRLAPVAESVAVVTGTFDMLQPGNLSAVFQARRCAEHVCVVLEPDGVAAAHLSRGRPWRPVAERAEFLSHLKDVSVVTALEPLNATAALESLCPYTCVFCPARPGSSIENDAVSMSEKQLELPELPGCSTGSILDGIRRGRTPVRLPQSFSARRPGADGSLTRPAVTVNGCFDVLHIGHTRFLEQARRMGNELVVLLNDDESVREYKGQGRPVFPAEFRSAALLSLDPVARVQCFGGDNPLDALAAVKPDIHAKGGSYEDRRVDKERRLVESWGGRLAFCPMVEGYSTTGYLDMALRGTR